MNNKREAAARCALLLCLLAFFALFTWLDFRYLAFFTDGDMYGDMALAREIWRQKTLFPDGWVFGNQYYIIATPVLAALFYGLTGSMLRAMALATAVMSLLIMLSFLWLLRPFTARRDVRLAALLLLAAAPMGRDLIARPEGQLFFVLASYYACYLITFFFVAGDYLRRVLQPERGRRLPALCLALALSFAAGMHSLRQMLVMALPILALEALGILCRAVKKERFRPDTLLRALAYALACFLGGRFMAALRVPTRTIYGQVAPAAEGLTERLRGLWHALRAITGLDVALYAAPRWFFLPLFLLGLLLVLGGGLLVLRRLKRPDGLALLWLLCVISLGGVLAAGLVLDIKLRGIYLFLWYPLVAVSGAMLLERFPLRGLTALLLAAVCALNLWFSYVPSLRRAQRYDDSDVRALLADAEADGYRYLYGTWQTLPRLAAYSDGRMTAGFWSEELFVAEGFTNLQNIYGPEQNARALYVFHPYDGLHPEEIPQLHFYGQYGRYALYTADEPLMRTVDDPAPG